MKESTSDLILHPVRLRILLALAGGKKLTAQEIGTRLANVPQATLYRQLNKLAEAGLLAVAEQHPVRGTIEKVYVLAEGGLSPSREELEKFEREDHERLFLTFLGMVFQDFSNYVAQPRFDMFADMVMYRTAAFYADDEELKELLGTLGAAMAKVIEHEPAPGRKRRSLTSILIPDPVEQERGTDE
ncbi:transcriptional regulator [Paenibacillus sp. J31TS4]|uniref:helix-turn-helix domain-containing protein n=1 Tax=Paenibacillus sp. J31TS4 TaxID=2807195 RepID=UPI001B2F6886|nr:helix-turn-helix domain-containing protein [Paenibacillus sp. J31TS4]GIP37244.1 transcriptional regulator [Paenibacillus sp. J31TS4]